MNKVNHLERPEYFKPFGMLCWLIFLQSVSLVLYLKTFEETFIVPIVMFGVFGLIECSRLSNKFNKIKNETN